MILNLLADLIGRELGSLAIAAILSAQTPTPAPPACATEYVLAMPSNTWVCLDGAK